MTPATCWECPTPGGVPTCDPVVSRRCPINSWRTPLFVQPPPMPELDDDQETDRG